MKTILLCTLCMLSGMLSAQVIDNPSFKARTGSIHNITRIERTPESTRVYTHVIFRPHWWINVEGDEYLEDADTGKKYLFKSAEGIEINKEVYMPDSGEMDYVAIFEPLPKETKTIHLLCSKGTEGNIYDISLVPQKQKAASPFKTIRGNWFQTNDLNAWKYGIYDSISLINNRIYTNESIQKKGKRIEMTVKDKLNGDISTLLFNIQKDGNCKIQMNGAETALYTQQKSPTKNIAPEGDYQPFFRQDTTYLQGYIDGYDPRFSFNTGLIYLTNELTGKDYPTVIPIDADGSFGCKFVINHPVEQSITIENNWIPFYIEPGQTLTMYIDWEALLARSRARDHAFPIKNTAYMGPSASLSYLLKEFRALISYPYADLSNSQKTLTPNQYKEHMKPIIARWGHVADSVIRICQPSAKAVRLIKNKTSLQAGSAFFSFAMSRDYLAERDTTNQALKVKEDNSYYDFLKEMPLNDETVLADASASIFMNRFEYMQPLRAAYSLISQPSDSITFTYPEKPLLSFFKEKGVKLNADQETIRLKHEKLAGTTTRITIKDLQKDDEKLRDLFKKEEKLAQEYISTYSKLKESSQLEMDEACIVRNQQIGQKKDSIIALFSNEPYPVLWQIAKIHNLSYELKSIKTNAIARKHVDHIKQTLTQPFLATATEQLFEETYPLEVSQSYALPEGKATEIFRNIIKKHPNKVLFVDFWATTCGPCRGGIEATADLRKKYKDHPEFQFIYITGQNESPANDYEQYVEKNLKGEASYYLSQSEYNYLRQLFHFNGIPHYELVEKDGSISKERVGSHSIGQYLMKRFGTSQPSEQEQNVK